MRHLSLFTQLCAFGLRPPALSYYDVRWGTTFYSLPIGLQEQDLTREEKDTIHTLVTLTEINLETMNKHRRETELYTWKLMEFMIKTGLRKVLGM